MMKYELNTPYDLNVRNVVKDNGNITFEVEIGEYLFPVRAFPEQLEGGSPSKVSCRIVQDKNKDAYLVQNEAFYYPSIYKPDRRYLFEVVDIKDTYIVLQDKYGLLHTLDKDGSRFSKNEIIVRYVEIVNDNDYKAHLHFNREPVVETVDKPTIVPEEQTHVLYAPTVFEQDPPKLNTDSILTKPVNNIINNQDRQSPQKPRSNSVSSMLLSKEWNFLLDYLDKNLKGGQIKQIQDEIVKAIENCHTSTLYWEMVGFLLNYDTHMFIGTITKTDISHIPELGNIESAVLDDIVHDAFMDSEKTKSALTLLKPCKSQLTTGQKNYIQEKCAGLNTCEAFYDLFKLVGLTPDHAVYYLLSLQKNIVAAFTLYKFYVDAKKSNSLHESSIFEAFRPSKISEYIKIMEKTQSFAFITAATLIKCNVLSIDHCPDDLQKEVGANRIDGFKKYIDRQKQIKNTNIFLSSLSRGDTLSDLTFIKELDNYYLLVEQKTGTCALLDKDLTVRKPNEYIKSQVSIVKKMSNNGKTVFIVAQKKIPSMYTLPPLVNYSTILDLAFSERKNGVWYPEVKNYTKLLNVEIEERPRFVNLKLRQKAAIIRKIDFFTYGVKILQL